MSTIRRERRPLDITYHIDTPGVPVSIRYVNEIIERAEDGSETILKSEITADSQADAATIAQHLGDSLASGRTEEQRALAAEQAAHAECTKHEATIATQTESLKAAAAHRRELEQRIAKLEQDAAEAAELIARLRKALAEPMPQEIPADG